MAADLGFQALPGDFFHFRRLGQAQALFTGLGDDTAGNGMVRRLFCRRAEAEDVIGTAVIGWNDLVNDEVTFGNGTGLIEDDGADVLHLFHGNTALEEDALFRRRTDTGEEAQGYAEDQGAGAADDQKSQSRINPVMPLTGHQGRNDGRSRGDGDDSRCIDAGKARNETVDFRLARRCPFDGFQNLRDHRFCQGLGHFDVEDARRIDAARQDFRAFPADDRNRFPCQGRRIDEAFAGHDDTVQGDAVTDADDDDITGSSVLGRDGDRRAIGRYAMDDFRAHIDGGGHLLAAAVDGPVFHGFADAAEEHDGDGFWIVTDGKGADGSHGHEEIFIERLALHDVFSSFPQDAVA